MAGGQISPSPIDFYRRPYNTVALPCERVICLQINSQSYYFIFKNVGKDKPAKEQEKEVYYILEVILKLKMFKHSIHLMLL